MCTNCAAGTERLHVLLPASIRPSCITNGCSYGESDTSNWEYHPECVDGEVGLVVDKVLGIWRRIQAMGIER